MSDEFVEVETTEPTPDVAPEAAAEPAEPAEPEVVYDADWLNEDVNPEPQQYYQPPQQQQFTQPQQAAYNQQMQQFQQPPQYDPNADLNRFVSDPRGTMSEIARQEAMSAAQQYVANSMGPVNAQMNAYMEGQVGMQTASADSSIRQMYQTQFSKDEAFSGNEGVRNAVKVALSGLRKQAEQQARSGNPQMFAMFHDPNFARVTLAAAKAAVGVQGGAMSPASVPHVEGTSPSAKPDVAVEYDVNTYEAVRSRFGEAKAQQYVAALAKEQNG